MLQSAKKLDHVVDAPSLIGTDNAPGHVERALDIDPTLSTAWLGLVSVMVSAEIDVTPAGARPEIVDFIREALFRRPSRRFADFHTDLLQALIYGCAPFEVTLNYNEGRWWLQDLAFVSPRHFDLASLKKQPGEWWVTGRCYVDHKPVAVGGPGSGLPVVWWPIYGRGILGSSLLRPVIEVHNEKSEIIEQRRVALQKSIQGSLLGMSRDPGVDGDELSPDDMTVVAEALAKCADGTDNAVVLPYQIASVQPVYPASDSISKSIEAEDHCDLTMLCAFGSQATARGLLSQYGSQNSSNADNQAQQALRGFFFQWAARQFQDIIDWLVDVNFGPQAYYPELNIVSSAPQSPESLVRASVQLSAAGALTYTDVDEAYFRRLLRLPQKSGKPLAPVASGADSAPRVPGEYDSDTGLDTRDRTIENQEAQDERSTTV